MRRAASPAPAGGRRSRPWKAFTPSTVPRMSAYRVGYGSGRDARVTKTSYTIRRLDGSRPGRGSAAGTLVRSTGSKRQPSRSTGEAQRGQVERHGLQAALEHQGARHAGVVLEVAREEPVVGRDGGLRPQVAAAPRPAGRVEGGDLVEQQQPAGVDARACARGAGRVPGRGRSSPPAGPRRRPAPVSAANDGAAPRTGGGSTAGPGAGGRSAGSQSTPPEPASSASVKNPAWPSRTVSRSSPSDVAVVVEEEQPDAAVLGVAVDVDLVAQRLARPRAGCRGRSARSRAGGRPARPG